MANKILVAFKFLYVVLRRKSGTYLLIYRRKILFVKSKNFIKKLRNYYSALNSLTINLFTTYLLYIVFNVLVKIIVWGRFSKTYKSWSKIRKYLLIKCYLNYFQLHFLLLNYKKSAMVVIKYFGLRLKLKKHVLSYLYLLKLFVNSWFSISLDIKILLT